MKNEIQAIIEKGEFEFYGIRVMTPSLFSETDHIVSVGETLPNSYIWDDGEPTDDQLNGVCAIALDDIDSALRAAAIYQGEQIVLIGSNSREWGEDEGEIIMQNGIVLAVWGK